MFHSTTDKRSSSQENLQESLEHLQKLEIYTKKRIQAHLFGEYESSQKGLGFEFVEHRRYRRGEDYRRIDWNVTSRFQFPYVKIYAADKEIQVWLLTDLSSSMSFGSGTKSKEQVALEAIAVLGFSASYLNMKVGFLGFSEGVDSMVLPRQSRAVTWDILSRAAERPEGRRATRFEGVVETLRERIRGTSMLFFISDFISLEKIFQSADISHLARHHDLIPVVIEDPLERGVPAIPGFHRLEDPETGRSWMSYWSRRQVQKYHRQMEERRQALTQLFFSMDLDFLWIDSGDQDFVDRFLEFFIRRRRLG